MLADNRSTTCSAASPGVGAHPDDAVGHFAGDAVLVDVAQARHPVGRGSVRGGEEQHPDPAGHFDVLGERFGGEDRRLSRTGRGPVPPGRQTSARSALPSPITAGTSNSI